MESMMLGKSDIMWIEKEIYGWLQTSPGRPGAGAQPVGKPSQNF
jgi:hypothetical protein